MKSSKTSLGSAFPNPPGVEFRTHHNMMPFVVGGIAVDLIGFVDSNRSVPHIESTAGVLTPGL